MSNGTVQPLAGPTMTITGIPNNVTVTGKYPPVVTFGQGGFPGPEDGPKAVPPGCAFGLPKMQFGGPWQPYTIPNTILPG